MTGRVTTVNSTLSKKAMMSSIPLSEKSSWMLLDFPSDRRLTSWEKLTAYEKFLPIGFKLIVMNFR